MSTRPSGVFPRKRFSFIRAISGTPLGPTVPELPESVVARGNFRRGVLEVEAWENILKVITNVWETKGGCPLARESSISCSDKRFNYWKDEALILFEEGGDDGEVHANVIGSRAKNAKIEYTFLPYLDRNSVKARPSFLVFHVTGHVMLGIYFPKPDDPRGPELHILNPWKVDGTIQMTDVYLLFGRALGPEKERKITVVDVAGEIERDKRITVNLQKPEQVGFCTLWVPIIADKVIPILKEIETEVYKPPASGSQLTANALKLYYDNVYKPLNDAVTEGQKNIDPRLGKMWIDFTYLNAARTVKHLVEGALASESLTSATVAKRKGGRRTYRKKLKWKRRGPRSSSTVRRTARRSVR